MTTEGAELYWIDAKCKCGEIRGCYVAPDTLIYCNNCYRRVTGEDVTRYRKEVTDGGLG